MKGLATLVISMSTNLNVSAYNDILELCASNFIATVWTGPFSHDSASVYKARIKEK